MRRNIDPNPMPQCRNVIQVIFTDLPEAQRNWWWSPIAKLICAQDLVIPQ
jgi:hypothetical protein